MNDRHTRNTTEVNRLNVFPSKVQIVRHLFEYKQVSHDKQLRCQHARRCILGPNHIRRSYERHKLTAS